MTQPLKIDRHAMNGYSITHVPGGKWVVGTSDDRRGEFETLEQARAFAANLPGQRRT